MYIELNDNTKLREIQEVFSDFYPYLQINFYWKRHKKYESSPIVELVSSDTSIGTIRKTHLSGLLEILPLNKVADVEKEFQERFGLSVQILRKEKNKWEQTTGMDDFTLKELNEFGRSSSDEFIVEDYDEGFEEEEERPEKLL